MPVPLFKSSSLRLGVPLSWRPPESPRSRCMAERRGVFKQNILDSSFSSTFFFLLTISMLWLLGRICNGSITVVWMYLFLFCVTIDAYWRILIRFGFWHTCASTFYLSLFLRMPARGATSLKLASEKPLLVVNALSDFPTRIAFWLLHD